MSRLFSALDCEVAFPLPSPLPQGEGNAFKRKGFQANSKHPVAPKPYKAGINGIPP